MFKLGFSLTVFWLFCLVAHVSGTYGIEYGIGLILFSLFSFFSWETVSPYDPNALGARIACIVEMDVWMG